MKSISTASSITIGNIRIGRKRHTLQIGLEESGTAERYEYFFNIIRRLTCVHGMTNRRWFITYDGKHDIPDLDGDCVVFIYGDERSLPPWRYARAGLILKAYGMRSRVVERFRLDMPWALDRIRLARNQLQGLDVAWRLGSRPYQDLAAKTLSIPLGYARQRHLPIRPLTSRRKLIWFAGSLHNAQVPALSLYPRLANIPKLHARRTLVATLSRLKATRPDWPIELQVNPTYQASQSATGKDYAEQLMDTRICVAPRGTTAETHRFFEAMRAGCVVVSQELPDFWFYRSAPAIRLHRWTELEPLVERLLAEPDRMEELHEGALQWWQTVAGPKAMADMIASILEGRTTVAAVSEGGRERLLT